MPDVDNNFISLYESPTVAGNIIIKKIDPSRKIPSINDKSFQKFIKKKMKKNEYIVETDDNGILNYFIKKIKIRKTMNYQIILYLNIDSNIFQLNAIYCIKKIPNKKKHSQNNVDHALECARELINIIMEARYISSKEFSH